MPAGHCDTAAAQADGFIAGTECGPYGERLIVQVVDELARKTPERIYATITRSPYEITEGFRDVTIREFANAVNCAAWWIDGQFGLSKTFDVIAYIGISDIRYAVFLFAAIKCGYQLMIPSVRNSESQHLSVLDDAKCIKILHTVEFNNRIDALTKQRPNLQNFTVTELDELLLEPKAHYPYDKTWDVARSDPVIIAHSSGSTGNPKPTTITNGVYSVYDNHRKIPKIDGRKNQSYELLEFPGGGRFYNPFPPYHLTGLFAMTSMVIFYNSTVTLGPPEKPPTGELLSQAMQMIKIRAAWCPPTVIEQLLKQENGFEQAASLDWIMYGGGPLAPATGDRLSQVTNIYQLYGSSETGPHIALAPSKGNWNWFEWHPMLENKMDPVGDGTFEMVVEKESSLDWIRHLSQAYPSLEVWRTNDLFVRNPSNPKLWQFAGRRDDVIVLSTGEKFNPVSMEQEIVGHPLVAGALILGTARFQAALLVEPQAHVTMGERQFIDDIWPTIEKANRIGPSHGRIFRSKIAIARPEKLFLRAGKGTVIRGLTNKLFSKEIDALYLETHEGLVEDTPELTSLQDVEALKTFVRDCVARLYPQSGLSDSHDLFVSGFDSLQTMELTKTLQRAINTRLQGGEKAAISARTVYDNPSVNQLAFFLHRLFASKISGEGSLSASENDLKHRAEVIAELVKKYTANLPINKHHRTPGLLPDRICVALTGSTGSLGSYLLEAFLIDPKISKVYCLNRSTDARTRQEKSFNERGVHYDLSQKCEYLTVAFGDAQLGLSAQKFEELRQSVDAIIHNAWKVDFNHKLESFEDVHIRGVRNMVDWSLSSQRHPRLFYVSSISSVGNWMRRHGTASPVPEKVPDDNSLALGMGYGESKHVSEQIINIAVEKAQLRASILRVGQIAGPLSEDGGKWNTAEWMPTLLKTSKNLGCIPDSMNQIDWIPVDDLAHIIQEILHCANSSGVYNLVNPITVEWMDLVPSIQEHWQSETEVVSFTVWLERLKAQELRNKGDIESLPALKLVEFYENLCAEASAPGKTSVVYDTLNGRQASETMAKLSPVNANAMGTWLRQWQF